MSSTAPDRGPYPPWTAWLLPIALLSHQVEEWFGGFPEWSRIVFGRGVTPGQFLLINSIGLIIITFGTAAAFRERRLAWIVASIATLMGLNAVLHGLATALLGPYSPGTATGLLLALPVSVVVLRSSAACLPRHQFIGGVLAGVLLHGAVSYVALA